MTVLAARVAPERAGELERIYRETAASLPPGIVETMLIRDAQDAEAFRIVTIWKDRAALAAMRASGETPKGIQMFRAVGAEPVLAVFDVVTRGVRVSDG